LKGATRTIILFAAIFLSLMLLSEAVGYAPKVPAVIHLNDNNGGDSNSTLPEDIETTGSMTSLDSGKNLGDAKLFELLGSPETSYVRLQALEVYEGGYWFAFNGTLRDYDHRPIEHVNVGLTGRLTSFYVNPLFPMKGFIPSVLYTSEIGGSDQLIYYPNQMAYYSKTPVKPYPVTYYEWSSRGLRLEDGRLVTIGKYVAIPENVTQRLKPLALSITAGFDDDYSKLRAIESYLLTHYTYDLHYDSPPEGVDPVEWFLFDSMRGVCWHFNSAFVLLARSIGLPARLVTGYKVDPSAEYQVVKADQLHAWAEVEFEGFGWVAFDATPPQSLEVLVPGVIPTNTTITRQDVVCLKGKTFSVEGRVTSPAGPVNDAKVIAYMKLMKFSEPITVGFSQVVNGSYVITCEAPRYLSVGDYLIETKTVTDTVYIGSSSDPPIMLKAETFFNVSLPSMVIADKPFNIEGVLREKESSTVVGDVDYYLEADEPTLTNGQIVFGGTQGWYVGTTSLGNVTEAPIQQWTMVRNLYEYYADQTGKINIPRDGLPPGNYSYTLSWNGTNYLLPASESRMIWAVPLTVTPKTPEKIFRAETTQLTGTIRAMNLTGSGERVQIFENGTFLGSTLSDDTGVFKLPLVIPVDNPLGKITLEYVLERNNYSVARNTTINARTQLLTLDQKLGYWYTPFNVTAMLTDDHSESMPGMNLTLSYIDKGVPTTRTVATDESGFAVFPIKLTTSPYSDKLHFNLTYQNYGYYSSSRVEGDLSFAPAVDYFSSGLQVILIVVSLATVFYFSRRVIATGGVKTTQKVERYASVNEDGGASMIQADEAGLGLLNLVEKNFTIDIVAPELRAPYPKLWGVNDPLTLKFTLRDKIGKPVPHAKLVVKDGEKLASFVTGEQGELEIVKSYPEAGVREVKVLYDEAGDGAEAIFRVKIVVYRSEVIGLLNEYLEKVREKSGFSDKHTVREIVDALKLRSPKSRHQDLETLADVFEEAEYSLHSIVREHYERFYSAEMRVLETF